MRNNADEINRLAGAATSKRKPDNKEKTYTLPSLPDTKDIRALALSVEPEIFEVYYSLMKDEEAPPAVRKSCADALLDRAKGKPEQAVTQTVKIERPEVSINEVARMMTYAIRDSRERGVEFKEDIQGTAIEVDEKP